MPTIDGGVRRLPDVYSNLGRFPVNSIIRTSAFALCLFASAYLGCGKEASVSPASDGQEPRRTRLLTSIATTAAFEAAWNGGNFSDGTVFFIEAGNTLEWTTNVQFAATNKTFSLIGEDTTAVLKKSYSGGGSVKFFVVTNNGQDGLDSLYIDNLKFVRTGGQGFFLASNYSRVEVTDAVMDLEDDSFAVSCNSLLIDGLNLRAMFPSGLNHFTLQNQAFDHQIRNSVFRRKLNGSGPCNTTIIAPDHGTVTWDNNQFFATSASDGEPFYSVRVQDTDGDISFVFTNNNFRKQTILFNSACLNAAVDLVLANNNSDLVFCGDGEDLIECTNCDDPAKDFDLLISLNLWSYLSQSLDYDDFGPVSDQSACVDGDTAYVQFSHPSQAAFEEYQTITVVYGDDDCVTSPSEIAAWFNSTTGKWNTAIDVTAFPDGDFYWHAKGILCAETNVGTCVRKRLDQTCGPGGKPNWYQPHQED